VFKPLSICPICVLHSSSVRAPVNNLRSSIARLSCSGCATVRETGITAGPPDSAAAGPVCCPHRTAPSSPPPSSAPAPFCHLPSQVRYIARAQPASSAQDWAWRAEGSLKISHVPRSRTRRPHPPAGYLGTLPNTVHPTTSADPQANGWQQQSSSSSSGRAPASSHRHPQHLTWHRVPPGRSRTTP